MKMLFKWDGNWQTVLNHIPKQDVEKYFGEPVTSKLNLGVWVRGEPRNCNIGDYVVKQNNIYEVKDNAEKTSK